MAKQATPNKKASTVPSDQAADVPRTRRARTAKTAVAAAPGHESGSPTYEQIARRAYQRFLERGGAPGNEMEDWLGAENDLRAATKAR